MTPFADALARALACRAAHDDAGQLAALLDAWRLVPDPELAEAIDEVSLRFERAAMPDFTLTSNGLRRDAWREVAARGRPEDLPWLLAALFVANWIGLDEITAIAVRPADPRVARALGQLREWRGFKIGLLHPLKPHVLTPAAVPEADRDLHAQVVAPVRAFRAADERLLEAVWAAPGDDAPRLVYADWLLEQGRPRGEYIAVACARARGDEIARAVERRLERLARRFRVEWAGGVGDALWPETMVYERGFLAAGYVRNHVTQVRATIGRPEWSTVHRLRCHTPVADLVRLVTHPIMRSLRVIEDVLDDFALALCAHPEPLAIERLGLILLRPPTPAQAALLAAAAPFPRLVEASVGRTRAHLAWLPGSAFARGLRELHVYADLDETLLWLADWAEGRFPALRRMSVDLPTGTLVAAPPVLTFDGVSPGVEAYLRQGAPQGLFPPVIE